MEFLNLITQNLISPPILFFVLGCLAGLLKSDLDVPESISRYLSIYLMMSIGFKGGVAMANVCGLNASIVGLIMFGVLASFLQPFLGYGILRFTARVDKPTAAAVAAHYGSISIVTFVTASAFLKGQNIPYEGYIVAVLALMEAPAILAGLFIAHHEAPETKSHKNEEKRLTREIFTNGAILLLFGAFCIGWLTKQGGMETMSGFLVVPFQGFLCLFLLDMGIVVMKNIANLKKINMPLVLFGLYMPFLGALIGGAVAWLFSIDLGTGTLFIVLCASASYIAVPAAMRLALPEANASIYLPLSLAITFPLNVLIGIPIYFRLAQFLLG